MTRDPDLDLAITELRPVFARMRAEKAKLRYERVRNDLNGQAAVTAYVRELLSETGLRADRIGLDYDAFMAILAIDANEIKRPKTNRKPSARQMTVALEAERKGRAEHVRVTEAALARADADYREALRLDAAARGACNAYTGYAS